MQRDLWSIDPLFKKNNPEYIENYRPVALISIFAKLLEKFMYNRLYMIF